MLDYDTVSKIKAILSPLSNQEDNFVWGPSANGLFSIIFRYWLQYNNMCSHPQTKLLKQVCNLNYTYPEKARFSVATLVWKTKNQKLIVQILQH